MAAIDKIYVNSYEEFIQFREWCKEQSPLIDKYGRQAKLTDYIIGYWEEEDFAKKGRPIFSAPYYVDAYLIRNCPFDFIQKDLMLNYGHWSQERIKDFYEDVKNWNEEVDGECPYWAKLVDFITLEDGTMTIKGLEKSDYERIKDGELYTSPKIEYVYGTHFRCTKHPKEFFNRPFESKWWWVSLDNISLWYHASTNTWDFSSEFVIDDSSSHAFVKTIRALKRLIRKWKLPVGTVVSARGRYMFDDYEFVVTP